MALRASPVGAVPDDHVGAGIDRRMSKLLRSIALRALATSAFTDTKNAPSGRADGA